MNGDRMMIQDLARRVRALEERLSPSDAAPSAPTLREQVARAICDDGWDTCQIKDFHEQDADAVLAVVADWLAAQPKIAYQPMWSHSTSVAMQRDHDVRLIRGGGDRG